MVINRIAFNYFLRQKKSTLKQVYEREIVAGIASSVTIKGPKFDGKQVLSFVADEID